MRMVEYKLVCLSILTIFSDAVSSTEILKLVEQSFNGKILAEEKSFTNLGQLKWHCKVYNALTLLKSSGLAANPSRGWWRLSGLGKDWMNAYGKADWETCCRSLSRQKRKNDSNNDQTGDLGEPPHFEGDGSSNQNIEQPLSVLDEYKLGSLAKSIALKAQDIVNQKVNTNSDDELCGLVEFCYRLELYPEGACLFSFINADKINQALYSRASRIASVCRLHSFE